MELVQYRMKNKMSQSDVAKLLGISKSTYGHYETGKNQIPIDRLVQLSKHYNVTVDALLGLDQDRNYPMRLLAERYGLTKSEADGIIRFVELSKEKRKALLKLLNELQR